MGVHVPAQDRALCIITKGSGESQATFVADRAAIWLVGYAHQYDFLPSVLTGRWPLCCLCPTLLRSHKLFEGSVVPVVLGVGGFQGCFSGEVTPQ